VGGEQRERGANRNREIGEKGEREAGGGETKTLLLII
jgi:hypothetical protein